LIIGIWLFSDQLMQVVAVSHVELYFRIDAPRETSFFDAKFVFPGIGAHCAPRDAICGAISRFEVAKERWRRAAVHRGFGATNVAAIARARYSRRDSLAQSLH